jgi:general secretion pathway protein D
MTTTIHRPQSTKRALVTCFAMVLCCSSALVAGPDGGSVSGIAQREMARRMQRVHDAEAAIAKGDALFAEGDYEGALNEYKTALDLLPDAPMTASLREVATARYCDAAVELARERAKNGRYDDARALLNDALARNPDHVKAKKLLKELDDPDRYEPALTPEHVKNVQDVERNLEKAYSYYNLGDYDNAIKTFQDVLRIDHYNSAARRGMERTEQKRSEYFDTARDHTRSKMLSDVNKGWEDSIPASLIVSTGTVYGSQVNAGAYYAEKMQKIIFPQVQFQGASVEEAVEFLRIKSRDYDVFERDPTKKGVNLIIKPGVAPSTAQISLDLKDVPMSEALKYITELGQMKYKIEAYAVVVVPLSEVSTEMYSRTFKVPPNFLTSAGGGGGGAAAPAAPADPFAPAAATTATPLSARPTAIDVLKNNGISFPEGASASFVPGTSQLIVRNTSVALDQVEALVDELSNKGPQQIYITTKFVEVSQKNTDELGFDWLLGSFGIGGDRAFGSGGTLGNSANGQSSAQLNADFPTSIPGSGGIPVGQNPVTRGNRSGNAAITPDSIDGLLAGITAGQLTLPASGIFALTGVFTDPQFQVVIRALSQKKGVDLMSAPSVTTRSGQRATIEVIREFIYPTEFDPPQIPQTVGATSTGVGVGGASSGSFPVTPTTPTAFEMRPVGVRMEVDPVIGPDGYTIDLNLAPEVTEFEGFVNYGSPINTSSVNALGLSTTIELTPNIINQPIFSTRKVTTAVTVWDGQTVAIGGLIREDVQDVEDKVPILGDIPVVGRLFQSKSEDHFKRNLMIFVTAKLIDPSGELIRKPAVVVPAVTESTILPPAPVILPPPTPAP